MFHIMLFHIRLHNRFNLIFQTCRKEKKRWLLSNNLQINERKLDFREFSSSKRLLDVRIPGTRNLIKLKQDPFCIRINSTNVCPTTPNNFLINCMWMATSGAAMANNNNKVNKKNSYKDLNVEKLLKDINSSKIVLTNSKPPTASSSQTQLQEGIQKTVKKTLKDWKSAHKSFFILISLIIIVMVPPNVLYCWYNPIHREKASQRSPEWGRFLNWVLDPLDDDVKQKAGILVNTADNDKSTSATLKQNIALYKKSLENASQDRDNDIISNSPSTVR